MKLLDQIYTLVEQKKEKFSDYERATGSLLDCEPDSAEHYIIKRSEIANEIDGISEQIAKLCDGIPNGHLVLHASLASVDYDHLPPEYVRFFDVGQATRSIVYRIAQTDKQAMERMRGLRNEALDKIKENQNLPKIKNYLTGLNDKPPGSRFMGGKA